MPDRARRWILREQGTGTVREEGTHSSTSAALAEWLRRQPAKLMGNARVGSNPAGRAFFHFFTTPHL